jgi:proton glutamate symport protein
MWRFLRNRTLTQWILVAMAVGIWLGWAYPDVAVSTKPAATVFLRMIKSIIAPLLFGTLVVGIAGHGDDLKRVGRLALKSIVYFEVVTTVALFIGLLAVNLVKPGVGVQLGVSADVGKAMAAQRATVAGMLEHLVPQSFFEAAAQNEVLQIVFWSVLFGVALTRVKGKPKETMLAFCEGLADTILRLTGIIMKFAPIGVGAALAVTVGVGGLPVLVKLGKAALTLYGALVAFILLGFIPVALIARVPLKRFWAAIKEPALIAFSTTSSEAAMPSAFQHMEELGVPRRIVGFVIPTGYSFNLDGTTLYLSMASVFCAQAAGIHMTLGQQLFMMLTIMLTSKGVAGVPRAALVVLSGTVATFGLPLEAVAVLLGIDVIMDMGRTTINLVGNCLASVVMARWEGEFAEPAMRAATSNAA